MHSILIALQVITAGLQLIATEGYVHGPNHCYEFRAPAGWVADNMAGVSQGVPMVFYPAGSSWRDAPSPIYTRQAEFPQAAKTPPERVRAQVNAVVEQYRKSHLNMILRPRKVRDLVANGGSRGELWAFEGNPNGGTELVAYFSARSTVNFFVLVAANDDQLQQHQARLVELAMSYRESEDCKPCAEQQACTRTN